MSTLYGQNLRIFMGTAYVGKATNCTVTLNNETSDESTKDDVGLAAMPMTTRKSWTVQVDSLYIETLTFLTAMKNKTPFNLAWDESAGLNNATRQNAAFSRSGQAYITDITLNFNDREWSARSVTFTGTGKLNKDNS